MNLLHSAPETESVPTPLPEAAAGATVDRFLQAVRLLVRIEAPVDSEEEAGG